MIFLLLGVRYAVYMTGPFAQNINGRNSFNDLPFALNRKTVANTLEQITPYTDSNGICIGLSSTYSNSSSSNIVAGPHPTNIGTSPGTPIDFSSNSIKTLRGCAGSTSNAGSFNNRINSLQYSTQNDGSMPQSCGTSTEGHGINAYPARFEITQCHFLYVRGNTFRDGASLTYLSNFNFYWACPQ